MLKFRMDRLFGNNGTTEKVADRMSKYEVAECIHYITHYNRAIPLGTIF